MFDEIDKVVGLIGIWSLALFSGYIIGLPNVVEACVTEHPGEKFMAFVIAVFVATSIYLFLEKLFKNHL